MGLRPALVSILVACASLLPLAVPQIEERSWLAAIVAASLTAAILVWVGGWRRHLLLQWLRNPQAEAPDAVARAWGDVALRIERLQAQSRKDTQRERERLEDFLQAIEASPNGVLLLDAGAQIVWLNTQAADHFGLDPKRDLRQHITNLVRQPAFGRYLQIDDQDQVLSLQTHEGRSLAIQLRHYGEGARLLLSQDVSDRERTEAMRRDFVANVSHEIRTPLAALIGFVESMATLPLQEHERARVLELMRQQSNRMQSLVQDLLTLARLEGSPRPAPDQWWRLGDLLDLVRAEAESLSQGRHQFAWPSTALDVELAGVESEAHSAIANLLSNAVRYTPEQGQISLSVERLPDAGLMIRVSDSGPGIAAEHLPRLTERFYRVDGSRSRATGGTGLGLSIVKHVCQRHGGQLRIESEPGKGSVFSLVWPAVRVR